MRLENCYCLIGIKCTKLNECVVKQFILKSFTEENLLSLTTLSACYMYFEVQVKYSTYDKTYL